MSVREDESCLPETALMPPCALLLIEVILNMIIQSIIL